MMKNYDKNKSSDDENNKKRKTIIKIIIIIIIILLLLTSCSLGVFGTIGNFFDNFSSHFIKGDKRQGKIIYDKDLRFVDSTGKTYIDDIYRIEFITGELGTDEYTCTTSDSDIATCMVKNNYVEVYPKSKGEVVIKVIAETNGNKYIGRHKLNIDSISRSIKIKDNSKKVDLSVGEEKSIPIILTNLDGDVTASISNDKYASVKIVNNNVVIYGKVKGKTTVTISTTRGGKKYTYSFEVNVSGTSANNGSNSGNNSGSNNGNTGDNVKLSNENRLSSISFNNIDLKPKFNKDTFYYTSNVKSNISKTKLTIVKLEDKEKVSYTLNGKSIDDIDKIPLVYGNNELIINVISESGISRQYKIIINRENKDDSKSDDSSLKLISLSDGSLNPSFSKDKFDYKVSVNNNTNKITIDTIKNDSKSKITYKFNGKRVDNLDNLSLNEGENTVKILVTAEDGSTSTYTIVINRDKKETPEKSNDSFLKSLSISEGELNPQFVKTTFNYKTSVYNNIKEITVNSALSDSKSSVSYTFNRKNVKNLNDLKLNEGENTVKIVVTAEDGSSSTYKVVITREEYIESTDSSLKSLSVSDGKIDPEFKKDIFTYSNVVSNDVKKITITPKLSSSKAKVSYTFNGKSVNDLKDLDLDIGDNIVKVKVTAEDGTSSTYILTVTRKEAKSNDSSLKSIKLSDGSLTPVFKKGTLNYTVNVPYETGNITITPNKNDSMAKVSYTFNGKTVDNLNDLSLKVGENTVKVKVTAEDGTSSTYTIKVNRYEENVEVKSNDSSLKSLSVSDGILNPTFKKTSFNYRVEVLYDVDKMTISATKNDSKAKVSYTLNDSTVSSLKDLSLKVGENTVKIVVTAEDGSKSTYKVVVNRNKKNVVLSDDSSLKSLGLTGGKLSPTFKKDVFVYSSSVSYETTKISISPVLNDKNSSVKYTYNGKTVNSLDNLPLKVGENTVKVSITAEDGSTSTYTIKVNRSEQDKSSDSSLRSLGVSEGSLEPVFKKDVLDYNVSVDYNISNITVNSTKNDSKATIKYMYKGSTVENLNDLVLDVGDNVVEVVVTAEDGTESTYTITITRSEAPKSNNSSLESLSVNEGSLEPAFDKGTYKYDVNVEYATKKITIDSIKSDSKAKVKYVFNDEIVNNLEDLTLKEGKNVVEVVVTAEDGTNSTYTININRAEASKDNNLKSLSVSRGTLKPEFNKDEVSYQVKVDAYTDKITITSEKNSDKAKVSYTLNGKKKDNLEDLPLNIGDNIVIVTVTAEDGSKKDYSIVVTRSDYDDNNLLKSIEISDRDFSKDFNKNINDYNIKVNSDIDKLTINIVRDSNKSQVKYYVDGSLVDNLEDINIHEGNNVITISVISEKESFKDNPKSNDYTIVVYKTKSHIKFVNEEDIVLYMENLVDGKHTIDYKVYDDESNIIDYELDKVKLTIPNFKGSYKIEKDYIEIVPSSDDIGNSYDLKLSYLDGNSTINLSIKMNEYFVNTSVDKYYIDRVDGVGEKTLILNTNIFNNDINFEEKGNDLVLRNDIGYVNISSNGVKIKYNPDDNKNVTDYISYIVSTMDSGTYNIVFDGYVFEKHIGSKTIEIEITDKYSLVIDAKDGFYNSFTSKYEYVYEYGKEFVLDNTYMAYKTDKDNCKNYVLDYYEDQDGNVYHLGDTFNINKTLTLTAYYKEADDGYEIPDKGVMYLTDVNIFHNEEYYNKYHKDKIIYPGAHGSHVMTITNNTTSTVKLNNLNIDEDTMCVNNNCINMAYIVKHILPDEAHDAYYYGAENSYKILNKDVADRGVFNIEKNTYTHSKKIPLGSGIVIAPGDSVEIALLWQWDDSDDIADTAIGSITSDVDYTITVSYDYEITDKVC